MQHISNMGQCWFFTSYAARQIIFLKYHETSYASHQSGDIQNAVCWSFYLDLDHQRSSVPASLVARATSAFYGLYPGAYIIAIQHTVTRAVGFRRGSGRVVGYHVE